MTTQAEFISKMRRKLYDMTGNRFDDVKLRDWLNDAASEAARRTQCLRAMDDTIVVTDGTQGYPAPTDMLAINAVGYQATGSERYIDLDYHDYKNAASVAWSGLQNSTGTPSFYWTWGYPPNLTISLYPTPSESGTLTVHYYKQFEKLSVDDDTDADVHLDFPGGWDDMLVDGAIGQAWLTDRDQRFETMFQRFEQALTGLLDQANRYNDQAGSVVVGNNLLPAWLYDFNYD